MTKDRLAELIAWGDVADAMKEMAKGEGAVVTVDADDLIEMCASLRQLQALRETHRRISEHFAGGGCLCQFGDDGETPTKECFHHKTMRERLEAAEHALAAPPADRVLVSRQAFAEAAVLARLYCEQNPDSILAQSSLRLIDHALRSAAAPEYGTHGAGEKGEG